MIYLGWFFLFFGILRLLVAFVNWATRLYLPKNPTNINPFSVSILIPARNEENSIGKLLYDLNTLNYKPLEILIYNDNSTDNTAKIVTEFAQLNNSIRLINGNQLPKGWLGKNHACHQLALEAKGETLLFLDADVRTGKGLLEKSLSFMEQHKLHLLSIFPKQQINNRGTMLVVPIMNWILLSLLPLILVRWSGWKSFSAANGQFMMFDAKTYNAFLPHQQFKGNKVEDIAILRFFKEKKLKVATLLGDENISCNMYNNRKEAIDGFSKNVFQFFGGSSIATLIFAFVTSFAPFFLFVFNGILECIIYIISIVLIRIFVSLASKQSVLQNVRSMILQHLSFWQIIYTAFQNKKNKTIIWKERNIFSLD